MTVEDLAAHSAELAAHSELYFQALRQSSWLESKISEGGTSTARVEQQLELARTTLDADASV